ncbi:MAG TPA: hypothetical protein DHW02_19115 [Ktedonobacter sp.]|nr:hypothetical protein [Ktedonobacter sp.]
MYSNPNDFSEYDSFSNPYESAQGPADYAHPNYYIPNEPSVQSHEQQNTYNPYNPYNPYEPYSSQTSYQSPQQMEAYRGPTSVSGYTTDVGAEQREAAERGSVGEENKAGRKRKGLAGIGGILSTIIAFLLKFKGVIFLIKFAPAVISAAVSIGLYSIFLGWPFAVGLVAILFLHEMGHAIVMKIKGIPVGGLIFIPMLGAAVTMRQMPQNARDEAQVGIAGPIAGALTASACLAIAQWLPNAPMSLLYHIPAWLITIWAPLAYFGFFINLLNLVPVMPFDGGRVLAAIDRRIWYLGFAALLGYQIWLWLQGNFSIWLLFFIFIAATQLWAHNGIAKTEQAKRYYDVPVGTRITLGLIYFGLAGWLVFGMTISHSLMNGLMQ